MALTDGPVSLVYSNLFYRGALPVNEFLELYTVPAAKVAVIRDMEAFVGGADTLFNAQVGHPADTNVIWYLNLPPASSWHQWQGRTVVPEGESIWGYSDHAGLQLTISGYLLST